MSLLQYVMCLYIGVCEIPIKGIIATFQEYNAMFCEVSAKKGTNVHDCCEDLTRALMKRENQRIAQTSNNIIPHSNDKPKIQEKSCSVCS